MIIHELGSKTNFVDENNVLVGFDTMQDCCEHARWWISESLFYFDDIEGAQDYDVAPYRFDPSAAEEHKPNEEPGGDVDAWIAFKMVAANRPNLYLHLANSHNGYYSHGFNVDVGGKTIWQGSL